MKTLQLFLAILIAAGLSIGLTWWFMPDRVIYATEWQQKQLDSLSVELRNSFITSQALRDSLESTTQAFQDRLDRRDEQVASYAKITGRLRLERDSLKSVSVNLSDLLLTPMNRPMFRDTTLTAESVYGDSLLVAHAKGGLRSDSLFLEAPDVQMIRPVRLDVAVTITDDRRAVHTLVTSRDLKDIHVEAVTQIRPEKKFPWFWVGVAAGAVGMRVVR